MVRTPGKEVTAALAALVGNHNFEVVRRWLYESREDLNQAAASTRDETILRWQQGSMQTLDTILSSAANAREAASKSR